MPQKKLIQPSELKSSKGLYAVMTIVIIGLIVLIGWFAYLLIMPDEPVEEQTNNNANINTNVKTESNVNNNINKNTNKNTNAESDATNENEEVEDEDEDKEEAKVDDDEDEDEDEGEKVTLYFPTSSDSCGDVKAVERKMTLGDDPYGEQLLAVMGGPNSDEEGYVDGIPSGVRLRQVQYTADGPLVTVSEGYNDLSECQKKTVDAQFIQTSNAMFDLPISGPGKVEVGTVSEENDADEDTNANTNTEE